jgi:hypothetical protein
MFLLLRTFLFAMFLLLRTFLFAMQRADAPPGTTITDIQGYDSMRTSSSGGHFGTSQEDIASYCNTLKKLHPEVTEPMEVPICEEALLLSGEGLPHGRLPCLNSKFKPTLTTSYTRLKAGLPKDSEIVQPRRKRRRSTDRDDVSFPHFHPLSDFLPCMAKC